jgi:dTDP-4-dehydrorhamnose reductase
MKILLTGVSGQVGWELARSLLPLGEVIEASRAQADLSNLSALRNTIQQLKPEIIINPAAYTAVDKAETEQDLAFLVNGEAPGLIAEEAKKLGAMLIHYSTDYVFDGSNTSPYAETDSTCPVNVYGASKLAGEQAIQAIGCDYLIFRTSWVYASRGNNFLKTILRLAAEREELKIVHDQIGAPTWARLIAEVTAHALHQSVMEKRLNNFNSGIYNLTASGYTSWHGFAVRIVETLRNQARMILKNQSILPIPAAEYPLPAKRPANSRLDTSLLESQFKLNMPSWEDSLKLCLQELNLPLKT